MILDPAYPEHAWLVARLRADPGIACDSDRKSGFQILGAVYGN